MPELRGGRLSGQRFGAVRRTTKRIALLVITGAVVSVSAAAQRPINPDLARAELFASRGDSAAARILVDSILADSDPTAPIYPGALYWRGALASGSSDARKDLLRLIVDYPFTEYVGDALYRLAQGEVEAGDQSNGRRHLTRLVRDHAGSTYGSAGALQLGKMLMADGEVLAACAALDSAYAHEPAGSVEVRNQIAYAQRPCDRARANAASAAQAADSPAAGKSARVDPVATARPSAPAVRWSVQVAALAARADATALAARLKSRGYDSRVVDERPYRVRIGRFATRAEATALAAKLKAENTTAIVVEAERP